MLLSASLIVRTLPSDSWWRKLLHFIFIISNNHSSFMSIVYNHRTACCVMKFKAVYRLQGSHTLFTYIYIYLYGFCFSTTAKQAWWMSGCGPTGDVRLPAELICGQATSSFTVKPGVQHFITVEPLHHLNMLCWQIKTFSSEECKDDIIAPMSLKNIVIHKELVVEACGCFNHNILGKKIIWKFLFISIFGGKSSKNLFHKYFSQQWNVTNSFIIRCQ